MSSSDALELDVDQQPPSKKPKIAETDDAEEEQSDSSQPEEQTPPPADQPSTSAEGASKPTRKRVNIAMALTYLGEKYQGLQKNAGAVTIEPFLRAALSKVDAIRFNEWSKAKWFRAARTDKGVSALLNILTVKIRLDFFFLNDVFNFPKLTLSSLHVVLVDNFLQKLNEELPDDIRVFGFVEIPEKVNARNTCDSRTYHYVCPTSLFAPRGHSGEFKFDEAMLARINNLINKYTGTHYFHNFTKDLKPNSREAKRTIMRFECFGPIDINGVESVRFEVHGASFLLYQIRKMIGTVIAIIRHNQPPEVIDGLFGPVMFQNVPMAPAQGLYLERAHFDRYNSKLPQNYKPVSFDEAKPQIEEFRQRIYASYAKSKTQGLFIGWVKLADQKPMDYSAILEQVNQKPQ